MTAPRLVLDSNVLLSALLFPNGSLSWLRHKWRSEAVIPLASLERAFGRLSDVEISQFIQQEVSQHLGITTPVASFA